MPVVFNSSSNKHGGSAFIASFVDHPVDVAFADQQSDEHIVLFLRRHPITNVGWILSALFLIFAPFFLFPFVEQINLIPFDFPPAYGFIFTLFWYLGTFAFIIMKFIFWYYNVNIITNKRVIDIDFIYLLYRENTATNITQIEDVTSKVGGFLRSIFDFGDIFVQTAGNEPNIEFLAVPHPSKIVRTINNLMGTT